MTLASRRSRGRGEDKYQGINSTFIVGLRKTALCPPVSVAAMHQPQRFPLRKSQFR